MLLLGINLSVYQTVLADINDFFGFEGASGGLLITLFFLGALVAPVIAGELSDRLGKKSVLIAASLIFIIGIVMVTQTTNVFICGLGVFFIGSGSCTVEGLLSAKITDENPESSEKLMNFSQLFFCVGAVLGPMLSLAARTHGADWQMIMLIVAIIFIPASFCILLLSETKKKAIIKDKDEKDSAYSMILLKDKKFLLFFFSLLLYIGAESGVAFSVTGYFTNDYQNGFSGEIALSLFWLGMIIGRFFAGVFHKISDKIMIACIVSSIIFSFLLQFQHQVLFSVALFFLIGLSYSAIWPLLMAFCTKAFPKYSGTAGGLMVTGGALGGMSIPILMSYVANVSSIRMSFIISTCSLVIILALYLSSRRSK